MIRAIIFNLDCKIESLCFISTKEYPISFPTIHVKPPSPFFFFLLFPQHPCTPSHLCFSLSLFLTLFFSSFFFFFFVSLSFFSFSFIIYLFIYFWVFLVVESVEFVEICWFNGCRLCGVVICEFVGSPIVFFYLCLL